MSHDNQNKTPADMLTRREAAAYLGVSEETLSLWASRKRYNLPYVKLGRKSVRYQRKDLDAFIASHKVEGSCDE